MDKHLKLLLIAVLSIGILLLNTAACFALFNIEYSAGVTQLAEASGSKSTGIVPVGDEFALKAACMDDSFNSPLPVSDKSTRTIVTLTGDIVLTSDLVVTADCGFNLQGYTLDLNGYDMTVRNAYYGTFEITGNGGVITSGQNTGNLIINLSKGSVDYSGIAAYIDGNVTLTIKAYNEEEVAQEMLDFIEDKILYGEHRGYYYDMVDLPLHYLSFDNIDINYISSNPSVLSNEGIVTASSADEQVTITVTISFDGGGVYTDSFSVRIITLNQGAAWADAEFQMFCDDMQQYKGESSGTYYFGDSIVLPKTNRYTGNTYSYRVYDDANGSVGSRLDTSRPYIIDDISSAYVFNSDSDIESGYVWLQFVSSADSSAAHYIKVCVISNEDAYSQAAVLFNDNLGDNYSYQQLDMELEEQNGAEYVYTTYNLLTSGMALINGENIHVSKFEYEFENPESCPYEIVETGGNVQLKVKESFWGQVDSETPDSYLRATVYYGEGASPQTGTEYIKVHFEENLERDFYPYYKFLDYSLKTSKTDDGYTYLSFDMPAKVSGKKPYVQYEIEPLTEGAKNYISATEYSPGVDFDRNITTCDFTIDTKNLTTENHKVRIYYWYSFDGQNWSKYRAGADVLNPVLEDMYYTDITILGIACDKSNNRAIVDDNLFTAIYNQYDGAPVTVSGEDLRVIPTDNMAMKVENFDVTAMRTAGSVSGDISDLTGIRLLTNTDKIVLRDALASDVTLTPLAAMENLKELDLGNNGITDMRSIYSDDGFGYSRMENLQVLWLDNNSIQQFYNLQNFRNLETVYVNDNKSTATIDGIFEWLNILYRLYGSTGIYNQSTYNLAIANGTEVFNIYESGEYSYSGGNASDKYYKAQNIVSEVEYQYITSNTFFNYDANGANADASEGRIMIMAGYVYGNENGSDYIPSVQGLSSLEGNSKPPHIVISETYSQEKQEYQYTIQIQENLRTGTILGFIPKYEYRAVLQHTITVKYVPEVGDVAYSESEPQMFMLMTEMPEEMMSEEMLTEEPLTEEGDVLYTEEPESALDENSGTDSGTETSQNTEPADEATHSESSAPAEPSAPAEEAPPAATPAPAAETTPAESQPPASEISPGTGESGSGGEQ